MTDAGWAVLELMGHRRLGGHVSEVQVLVTFLGTLALYFLRDKVVLSLLAAVLVCLLGIFVIIWIERRYPSVQERDRRRQIVAELRAQWRAEYITRKGNGIPHAVMMGTMPVPSEWINKRLAEMGEKWRV